MVPAEMTTLLPLFTIRAPEAATLVAALSVSLATAELPTCSVPSTTAEPVPYTCRSVFCKQALGFSNDTTSTAHDFCVAVGGDIEAASVHQLNRGDRARRRRSCCARQHQIRCTAATRTSDHDRRAACRHTTHN